jgi:hypothetical protein
MRVNVRKLGREKVSEEGKVDGREKGRRKVGRYFRRKEG